VGSVAGQKVQHCIIIIPYTFGIQHAWSHPVWASSTILIGIATSNNNNLTFKKKIATTPNLLIEGRTDKRLVYRGCSSENRCLKLHGPQLRHPRNRNQPHFFNPVSSCLQVRPEGRVVNRVGNLLYSRGINCPRSRSFRLRQKEAKHIHQTRIRPSLEARATTGFPCQVRKGTERIGRAITTPQNYRQQRPMD